jgi:hypothetical protein
MIAKQYDSKYKEHGLPSADSFIGQFVDKVRNIGWSSWRVNFDKSNLLTAALISIALGLKNSVP